MMLFSLIKRELQAAARQQSTYVVRVVAVGLAFGIVWLMMADGLLWFQLGRPFLNGVLQYFFYAGWVVLPLLTADCISRERREHTLELLFVSGAKGTEIVIAKAFVQALRWLTLWVTVVPLLVFSLKDRPITWVEALGCLGVQSSGACWPLAAGILVSSWNTKQGSAIMTALALTGLLGLGFYVLFRFLLGIQGNHPLRIIAEVAVISLLVLALALKRAAYETEDV